ncbi:MAG: aminotransferase class I/II-fold pyridoxal phosphate-dependent enzyme [Bacteroidales bacterium]|nr:aminotransferase class I/II-fold pyridoxal phosphate-dependent enzyme [Bacteroidales bacterium]MCF8344859.1 aminotransferase class I/II-fold pyridoxal phosphate-dependent enzyme [Bacteroidales bacterium]MCF8349955.1 aminotransferase class I/II-fold pyridoxal phosphate-dependent enzyme [Bacteroidales bacterium]MCF8376697.1 aminotransferase class I/II-fold pyridoxal phosphate-dependent enzyme [Bacteroidales bacterium]
MMIDLRSDTVTKPTREMLEAMFNAEVGDDVFEDDPTVKKLEEKAAEMFGKEAALFCPSGTMTNQIALKVHTRPGDEIICNDLSHIYRYEGGGAAFNSGASVRLLPGDRGRIKASQIKENINPDDVHFPRTSLVVIENTSNKGGGSCYEYEDLKEISALCKNSGLMLHLDGARIFNAIIEKNYSPGAIGDLFDSVSICLSKGLGAPVGSVLIGDKDFIKQSRRVRKVFGGGMRQAGYLAAAGIHALDHHIERLEDDHQKARIIANTLKQLSFVEEVFPVETNIIVFKLNDHYKDRDFLKMLESKKVKAVGFGPQLIRMVTHLDFTEEMLDLLIKELKSI